MRRRSAASLWIAAAFAALGFVVLAGRLISPDTHDVAARAAGRLLLAVFVLFPFLLYRFTLAFRPPARGAERALALMTLAMLVWTVALPRVPRETEAAPAWFAAYVAAFVVHFAVLSLTVAYRLSRAGGGQPSVARRRMHLLAAAAIAITLALVLAALRSDRHSGVALASQLLGLASALGFGLALFPPALLRVLWRRPEQARLQQTVVDLMGATTEEQVAAQVLPGVAAIVGARAAVLLDAGGRVVGSHGGPPAAEDDAQDVQRVDTPFGAFVLRTTPYAPYFGDEELRLLHTLGGLTALALDRSRLFAQERDARLALEHANEVKANFVALAAHELRTPVAAVAASVETLLVRGERLSAEQREQLERVLLEQSARLRVLVEQLLDLSRLDAQAVAVAPRPVAVRERVEEIVAAAAAGRAGAVRVEVPDDLEVVVDPETLERVVSNLVVNALRYGEPPVVVTADRRDARLVVTVEDRGSGVPPEFVPQLFERFTRSERTVARVAGTGLGLAIARSYALAHDGDLVYRSAEPHGARFELILPAAATGI